ncbi:hypothetical protein K1719_045986 [Acacia pycnantha]|nr:hypothetical protein K1719_045986 [Acacia pycnantha]
MHGIFSGVETPCQTAVVTDSIAMCFIFGKTKTPAELLRENKRMLDKSIREIERERQGLQSQEKKLILEIKKSAKLGKMDLERLENHFLSCRDAKHSEIQAEISELEGKIENGCDSKILLDGLHHSFSESLGKLDSAKKGMLDLMVVGFPVDWFGNFCFIASFLCFAAFFLNSKDVSESLHYWLREFVAYEIHSSKWSQFVARIREFEQVEAQYCFMK